MSQHHHRDRVFSNSSPIPLLDRQATESIFAPVSEREAMARVLLERNRTSTIECDPIRCCSVTDSVEQLRASEARFRNLVNYNADGIVSIDELGCIKFANPAAEALFRRSKVELIGQNLFDDLVGEVSTQLQTHLAKQPAPSYPLRVVQTHASVSYDDGGTAIVEMQIVESEWQGNTATAYLVTLRNITDRLQAERERDRFFTLSLDLLCVLDFDGNFQRLNPSWGKILGISEFQWRSHSFFELVHPDDRAATQAAFTQLTSGADKIDFENRCRHRDGSYRWFLWNAVAFTDDGIVYASGRDITERKRTEAQLIHAEKMSGVCQLVAGVAHEINNPIGFIYGNLKYVEEYTLDLLNLVRRYQEVCPEVNAKLKSEIESLDLEFLAEDLPKAIVSMQSGAERVRTIVSSLRNFSRLDEAEVKTVDLHQGIDSTLSMLQHRLKSKGKKTPIQIVKHYGDLPPAECYAGQLNQVFMYLLNNAIDALEQKRDRTSNFHPQISISTEYRDSDIEGDRRVTIFISDNGPGIPESVKSRIFDPFFTTKPIGKGTGLGLAIGYQIIAEHHGGSLTCRSQEGQGTEFCIEIPVRQSVPAKCA